MRALLGSIAAASLSAAVACGADGPLQGNEFLPEGSLPTEPPSDRLDGGGRACDAGDAGACEGGALDAAPPLPVPDGAAPPSNTCETARAFGALAGDVGSPTLTATGTCSEWVSLRVTEDNSGALGAPMKVTLTLKSTGHDFDLFAYLNPSKDIMACSAPLTISVNHGTADEFIPLAWGEGTVANGEDDGRTVEVAIQSAQGPCGAGASWTLTADGNR